MEASPLPTSGSENWAEQFEQSLSAQRQRVREFLTARQARLRQVEAELGRRLQQLASESARNRDETRQAREQLDQRSRQIAHETGALESLKEELATRRTEWEQLHQQASQQQQALAEHIQRQQDALDRRLEESLQRQAETEAAQSKLRQEQAAFEAARNESRAEQARLDALREGLEKQKAEWERQRTHGHEELLRQFEAAQRREEELLGEIKSFEQRYEQLHSQLEHQAGQGGIDPEALACVQSEREGFRARLAAAEEKLVEAERRLAEAAPGGDESDDYRRRYELAMEDLHELKAENAALNERLSAASASPARPAAAAGARGPLDWEAEKLRILAALESDFGEDDEQTQAQRLAIEEVARKTDQVISDKEKEIQELKQLLANQSTSVGAMAVGAAAFGAILDKDAVIREERENLKRIQEEWRGKLRQAEVEISVERAKIARERAQLEERLQALQERAGRGETKVDRTAGVDKPARGRWLARLGLSDLDEQR